MLALVSAALFGASTPFAKALLGDSQPLMLASMIYLGSGLGLFVYSRLAKRTAAGRLTLKDWAWFAPAILCGGIIGPILLLIGLQTTLGSTASLLLALEGVFSALIAWMVFGEHFHIRIGIGMLAITLGAMALAWHGNLAFDTFAGPALIVVACLAWAADNNLTRKVALSDPVQIAMIKGLAAGSVNFVTGLLANAIALEPKIIIAGGLLGFVSYGVGLVLFVVALRDIGSARTAAYYSVAPFIGALVAVILFGEPFTAQLLLASILMCIGVWLHLTERHEHAHDHVSMEHEHAHIHDLHHQHAHRHDDPPGEPHYHAHTHKPTRHTHSHYPDMHHDHGHGPSNNQARGLDLSGS